MEPWLRNNVAFLFHDKTVAKTISCLPAMTGYMFFHTTYKNGGMTV
jgi:hypothetical protein